MTKAPCPKSILVLLDDSRDVMHQAVRLARQSGAGLTALFVLDTGWNQYTGSDWLSGSGSRADYLDYARDHEFKECEEALAAWRQLTPDLHTIIKTPAGLILEEVLKEASSGHDLLVCGLPFARGLEKYRDFNVQLVKHAPCSLHFVKTTRNM